VGRRDRGRVELTREIAALADDRHAPATQQLDDIDISMLCSGLFPRPVGVGLLVNSAS
jgi:hypothetical protein